MPNFAFLRRHDQVGGEHDLGAAGQRVALDGGDERLARRPLGEADAAAGDRDDLTCDERLEVHARAEVAARAGDDRRPTGRRVVEFVHRVGETLADGEVDRVARIRPIDGDDENASAALRRTSSDTRSPSPVDPNSARKAYYRSYSS